MLLSSFGLCFSYRKASVKWLGFMKQRFSKIAIFYWFAIALAAIYRAARAIVTHHNLLQEINPFGILVNALFLHGFSPDNIINNQIVRGGWYIGTIIMLYALFPAMYRIYFKKGKLWEASRMYAFPLIVFALVTILRFLLPTHKYVYPFEKLLLQMTPFALGFPLFELQTTGAINKVKLPFCKGLLFAVLACILFFSKSEIQYVYIFSIGIAFFYFIVSVLKTHTLLTAINSSKPRVVRLFNAMGKYSYSIYLTHSYIAFDFCFVCTAVLSRIYSNDLLWFIALQPIAVVLSFYVGKCFHVVVSKIMEFHKFDKKAR